MQVFPVAHRFPLIRGMVGVDEVSAGAACTLQLNRFLNLSRIAVVFSPKRPRNRALLTAWNVSNQTLDS
jgi:hypothetical protein